MQDSVTRGEICIRREKWCNNFRVGGRHVIGSLDLSLGSGFSLNVPARCGECRYAHCAPKTTLVCVELTLSYLSIDRLDICDQISWKSITCTAVGSSVFNRSPQFFRSSLTELTEFLATGLLNENINFTSKDVSFVETSSFTQPPPLVEQGLD